MNDFRAEADELRRAEVDAAERVIRSGWYILGEEVKSFEAAWARQCNARHAVGVGNGLDAIELILRALNIGHGDEVITTPMTAFASVLAIIRAGATPVLADIDPETAMLDSTSVERCLTHKTKAVLLVHLYGQVRRLEEWSEFCAERRILFIEDCAQAHGASSRGRFAGTIGVAGAYSFYPTKNLGALGDAGAIITMSDEVAEGARSLRNYGQSQRYHHQTVGMNSRLDEMQAAILSVRLEWLGRFTGARRSLAQLYYGSIRNAKVRVMAAPLEEENHVYHLFVVLCEERERLMGHLRERGVESLIHYPIPIHHQKPTQSLRTDSDGLHHTERHAKICLSIPCHPQIGESEAAQVVDAVNSFK